MPVEPDPGVRAALHHAVLCRLGIDPKVALIRVQAALVGAHALAHDVGVHAKHVAGRVVGVAVVARNCGRKSKMSKYSLTNRKNTYIL